MPKNGYVVGIDIGTKKVTAVIGEVNEERKIEVIGIGTAESKGLRKGVVVNLDVTSAAIKKAQEEAELMAGVAINSAFIGISGAHIKSFNSRGVIAVSGKNREITRDDIRRVIEQSKAVSIPPDREIIHVIPQEFVVDDQDGIRDPLGMNGIKLEVNVHIVTGAVTLVQNLRTCVERAGIAIEQIVLNQIADERRGPDARRAGARRGADRHRGRDDRGGHLRAGQPLVHVHHPPRRRQLHERHRGRPADGHPRRGEDQEEVRLRRRPALGRAGDDRGARRSARAGSRASCRASSWPTSSSRGPRRSSGSWTTTSRRWATRNR